ncbi:MAG: serine/threonine protein kinase, partial [Planctomycetes bacterium]|nr:serine/threonine protein kinase [Planctomycetota bacterium]
DIKPDNLMICQTGAVKVADLGLAKPSGSGQMSMLSGTNVVMGTPQYMPPEQWENTATVTPAADVWALGATLYYLLVGGEAIAKDSLPRIMQRIVLQPFPDVREQRPDVPDDVAQLIAKATAKSPDDRFADARELAGAIERLATRRESLRDLGAVEEGEEHRTLLSPPPAKTLAKIKFWLDGQAQSGTGEGQTIVSNPATPGDRAAERSPAPARRRGGLLVSLLLLVSVAGALAVWQPWRAGPSSPFATADALARSGRYAEAVAETRRVFDEDPSLVGREARLAEAHLTWARALRDTGDLLGSLDQIQRSERFAQSADAASLRRAVLANAALRVEGELVREAPGDAEVERSGSVMFRGRLASALVDQLSIGGQPVGLAADGAFAQPLAIDGASFVPVRATLRGGFEVSLRDWRVRYRTEPTGQPSAPETDATQDLPEPEVERPAVLADIEVEPARVVLVGDGSAEVTFTVPAGYDLFVDGRKVALQGRVHRHRVQSELLEPNAITFRYTNEAGAGGGGQVPVVRELGELAIAQPCQPEGGDLQRGGRRGTNAATVRLTGALDRPATAVLVNGEPVTAVAWQQGRYTIEVPLTPGANALDLQFTRRFHRPARQRVELVRVTAPKIELVGGTRAQDRVAADGYDVRVACDEWTDEVVASRGDARLAMVRDPATGRFRVRVPLEPGENVITVRATNTFDETAERTLSVTRAASTTRPTLRAVRVTAGDEAVEVREGRQVFFNAGTRLLVDSDDAGASVRTSGVAVARGPDGSLRIDEVLPEPCTPTRLELVLENGAGSTEPFRFVAWRDIEPPVAEVTGVVTASPNQPFRIEGTWVDDGGLQRRGTTIGEITARVSPGGGIAKRGRWRVEHPGLERSTTLTLVMRDRAGNRTELQVPVTVE